MVSGFACIPGTPLHPNPIVTIGRGPAAVRFGNALPLALIAGPCALESRAHALEMAAALKEIAVKAGIGLVYKSSFDKANRTSAEGRRGLGLKEALPVFAEIRETFGLPVVTDIHEISQCGRRRWGDIQQQLFHLRIVEITRHILCARMTQPYQQRGGG